MKYKLLLAAVVLFGAFAACDYLLTPDKSLVAARAIYRGESLDNSAIFSKPKRALQLAREAVEAKKRGDESEFSQKILQSYLMFQPLDKTVAEPYLVKAVILLGQTDDASWFSEFVRISPFTADCILAVYTCGGNRGLIKNLNKNWKVIRKKFEYADGKFRNMLWVMSLARVDFSKADIAKVDKTYRGMSYYLGLPNWDPESRTLYPDPLKACLSKMKGREDLFEFYKSRSMSPENLRKLCGGYCEYAAKIYALCGEPKTAVFFLEMLPENGRKYASIKRALPYILGADGGREALAGNRKLSAMLERKN